MISFYFNKRRNEIIDLFNKLTKRGTVCFTANKANKNHFFLFVLLFFQSYSKIYFILFSFEIRSNFTIEPTLG
jgi:hypothetical protein